MKKMLIAMLGIFALVGCGEPENIQGVSNDITKVEIRDHAEKITLKATSVNTMANIVFQAAQWQARKGLDGIDAMDFAVMIPTKDRYGNEGVSPALTLKLSANDLRRVNWKGMFFTDIVDLAAVSQMTRFGGELVADFCGDADNMKFHRPFCMAAAVAMVQ